MKTYWKKYQSIFDLLWDMKPQNTINLYRDLDPILQDVLFILEKKYYIRNRFQIDYFVPEFVKITKLK